MSEKKLTDNQNAISELKTLLDAKNPVEQLEKVKALLQLANAPTVGLTILWDTGKGGISLNLSNYSGEEPNKVVKHILQISLDALDEQAKKDAVDKALKEYQNKIESENS